MQVLVSLRQVDDQDPDLIQGWLSRPHVSRWWGDPEREFAQIQDHQQDRKVDSGRNHALILDSNNSPLGYLRWVHCPRDLLDRVGFPDMPTGAVDIDIFVGEPDRIGRGFGPAALQVLMKHLWDDESVPLAGMSVSVENKAAIRAYEKVGFKLFREFKDPTYGPCWLMVCSRPESA